MQFLFSETLVPVYQTTRHHSLAYTNLSPIILKYDSLLLVPDLEEHQRAHTQCWYRTTTELHVITIRCVNNLPSLLSTCLDLLFTVT